MSAPAVSSRIRTRVRPATLALAAGVNPKVVQERLGHSSVTLTLDTYSQAVPTLGKDAAARLDALLGG
jgi:integrase